MRKDKTNTDRKTDTVVRRRKNLRCDICKPNRGENSKSHAKYGKPTKPKSKTNKREGLIRHVCPFGCPGCEAED